MKKKSYFIENFGCQMNISDSERIAIQLEKSGYVKAEKKELADLFAINTCCVRESAENRIWGHIGALKKIKETQPGKIILICGCMAQKDQQLIIKRAPHVDIVLGTQNIDRLAEILQNHLSRQVCVNENEYDGMSPDAWHKQITGYTGWIPIMYGCDNFCSYCIVPYVRGRERSRPVAQILEDVHSFVSRGGVEVTLLGQNVNSYGKNLDPAISFPLLLQQVDQIPDIKRIRFMTSHPKDFTDDLLHVMSTGKNICRHLHLPVQSGSDDLLQKMNRNYSTAEYRRHVEKLRKEISDISITTDIIVGFPGETERMFEETLQFMSEIRFDAAFTFLYSKRSGTPADKMADQISLSVKKERLNRLMALQNEISLQSNKAWVGRQVEVLSDGPSKTDPMVYTGRTSQNKIVHWNKQAADQQPGMIITIQIDSAQTFLLKGSVVSTKAG